MDGDGPADVWWKALDPCRDDHVFSCGRQSWHIHPRRSWRCRPYAAKIGPDGFCRCLRIVVVTQHHERTAIHQLAPLASRHLLGGVIDIDDAERIAGYGRPMVPGLFRP